MNKSTKNPRYTSKGMAFNEVNHFTTFEPDISEYQRNEAHQIMEKALNDQPIPDD
jgi:hypothetical protein